MALKHECSTWRYVTTEIPFHFYLEVTVSWSGAFGGDSVIMTEPSQRGLSVHTKMRPRSTLVPSATKGSGAKSLGRFCCTGHGAGLHLPSPLRMGRYFCCVCCFSVVGVDWDSPLQYLAKCSFFPGDYHSERPQAVSKLRLLLPNQKTTVSNIILRRVSILSPVVLK